MADSVGSIAKAFAALGVFSTSRPEATPSEIAAALRVPRPTVQRILKTLMSVGAVAQDPVTKRYRLGYRLFELGTLVAELTEVRRVALSHMVQLRDIVRAGVYLTIAERHHGLVLEALEPPSGPVMWSRAGVTRPLHAGSMMKVLLAHLPAAEIDAVIRAGLGKVGPKTITSRAELLRDLETIRKRGYAFSHDEYGSGGFGISAPIRGGNGSVIAGVGVGIQAHQFMKSRMPDVVRAVKATAARISAELGYKDLRSS
ncbi:MAG: IclR family transcriptional regulator [Candidatus Rokubacteria bacterium]|nr:IclR family transcriptional regulator [Candidatus Rokubacteria bacterium]MBI3106151.1 IclR family transcriptional regulator [Candidatus Rokubacteria bacterium]